MRHRPSSEKLTRNMKGRQGFLRIVVNTSSRDNVSTANSYVGFSTTMLFTQNIPVETLYRYILVHLARRSAITIQAPIQNRITPIIFSEEFSRFHAVVAPRRITNEYTYS